MPRWAARADKAQPEIVRQLRQCGVHVLHLHRVGSNAPDMAVSYRNVNVLLEIKSGGKPPGKNAKGHMAVREAAQKSWCESWQGPAFVVRSFEEAWAVIQKTCGEAL